MFFDFGTLGNLRNSDLVMWDGLTESWWQQFTGEAIVGDMAGRKRRFLSFALASWEDFKTANPDGSALDRPTGFGRPYGRNPYAGYDEVDNPPFAFFGDLDGRLLPRERLVALELDGMAAVFPFSVLREEGAVNYTVNGRDVAVEKDGDTESAFANRSTNDYEAVGALGVFDPNLEGQKLTFRVEGDGFVDEETGSVWNILGQAAEGPLVGKALIPVVHANHFWFAFGAFRPDTLIYQGVERMSLRQEASGT